LTHGGILQMIPSGLFDAAHSKAARIGVSDITREYSSLARP
jgi:hypothetical protein